MYHCANGYTKQAIIDKIQSDFKGKSINDGFTCLYRYEINGETRKCAIGLFIPDSVYHKDMEGNSISMMLGGTAEIDNYMPIKEDDGLEAFQKAHDGLDHFGTVEQQKQTLIQWVTENVAD